MSRAILDTSVFVAEEQGRPLGPLPEQVSISVVTLAELELGVLLARDTTARSRRLRTLVRVRDAVRALPVDGRVASAFSALVAELRQVGRRLGVNDAWIGATAIAHGAILYTQDADFDAVPGLSVIRV